MKTKRHLQQSGFTIVELMIALVLGLLVVGAVILMFISNKETYVQSNSLTRMQEGSLYALESIGRDIREAAGIPCGSHLPVANTVNNSSTYWWADWKDGISGFEGDEDTFPKKKGSKTADRLDGTDALIIHSGSIHDTVRVIKHEAASATLSVHTTKHGAESGDILMVCDYNQAAIFQATNTNSSSANIQHNTGTGDPGNCSKGLGYETDCTSVVGNSRSFENNGVLAKLSSNAWYVGNNSRGGTSLFRLTLDSASGTASEQVQEVVEGIVDFEVQYLERLASGSLADQYVDADSVGDWTQVLAARVILTTETLEKVSNTNEKITRNWYGVFTLRNRAI